jgi:hypothetical protein
MNVRSMFPSKFVAANDLCGQDVAVVIAGIKVEKVGSDDEQRPVIYFQGMSKGMVLNRTNARRIEQLYGGETESWFGKPITIYPSETDFAGETVPCIRVRPEPPLLHQLQPTATPPAPPPPPPPPPVAPPVLPTSPAAGGVRF